MNLMPSGISTVVWHRHGKDVDEVSVSYFLLGSCFLKGNSGAGKREW